MKNYLRKSIKKQTRYRTPSGFVARKHLAQKHEITQNKKIPHQTH